MRKVEKPLRLGRLSILLDGVDTELDSELSQLPDSTKLRLLEFATGKKHVRKNEHAALGGVVHASN
jgi:hypothetical protein